ncbi:hypothetical protein BCV73_01260 [Paenibacillus sp. SSG-1]|uniref:YwaF family protein n=1 Tax=Paenibacillus sp. SSG-1 TaxID=1443669 RepID=UPI000B7D4451|nr:TIGR02206 family membrane protein [Paenibacillus sp. SSG-1]OXL81847.1 hypothetical protein BCV73_01260 [Paenibacillus sp. SSG-1]
MSHSFVMFSGPHLAALTVFVLACILMFLGRIRLQDSMPARQMVRYLIIACLIASEIALDIWNITEGYWNIKSTLPLELCSITLLLSVVMLAVRSRFLYQILFFAGIGGALQALITPSLDFAYPHFRFFQFFAAHMLIILASLYMTWVEKLQPTWRSIGWTMIFLNVLALGVGLINWMLGSNYMFLMHKPPTASILDFLGPHPLYLLAEEGIALLIFALMQLLFFVLPAKISKASAAAKARDKSVL